jgi:hypothetical protein
LALVQRGGRVALEVSPSYGLPMPFKHNASRRHRVPRQRFRVMNWPAYEAGLRRRGDLTFWVDDAALAGWQAPRRTTSGGQRLYSDLAIELVLTLRLVFHLALRQAEAFSVSVLRLLGLQRRCPITRRCPAEAVTSPVASRVLLGITARSTSCSTAPAYSCSAKANGMRRSTATNAGSGASFMSPSMPSQARSPPIC